MRPRSDDPLFAWPVDAGVRAAEIERDPRTRAEIFAELFAVAKELRRVRARLEFVEDENERLKLALVRLEDQLDDDDDEDGDGHTPLALIRRC